MRLKLFLLFALTISQVSAQTDTFNPLVEPSPREDLFMHMANECVNTHRYNRTERLKFYPFNKAHKIKIISFRQERLIPVKKSKIDYTKVHEHTELLANQIDTLTAILYNVDYDPFFRTESRFIGEYKCYEPHNGILFLNEKGEAFEFIEICFDCHKTRSSSKKIIQGAYCNQKIDLLKDFFKAARIKYVENEEYAILSYADILKLDIDDVLTHLKMKLDSKLENGKLSDRLTAFERTLFFLLTSRLIYHGGIANSGLVEFYYGYSGAFSQQTIDALTEVGANSALAVLRTSLTDWPGGRVPFEMSERRKTLLAIANNVVPKWRALEAELYFRNEKDPEGIYSQKENLDSLIFNYVVARKSMLRE